MKIKYDFAVIYTEYKTRAEKNQFRNDVCEGCGYDKSAFWRRIRGDFSDSAITVKEIAVWMTASKKSFDKIVYIEAQ